MASAKTPRVKSAFQPVTCSLESLLGADYIGAVCSARATLTGDSAEALSKIARKPVDFYPISYQKRLEHLLPRVGQRCIEPVGGTSHGATSAAFIAHSSAEQAPMACMGYYRIGESGRLYLATKSAHYHAPLGHDFPGYRLIEHGRLLGIPNATHNNTRGHITRLLEEELVYAAAGVDRADSGAETILESTDPAVLNRVLNLETGSLAAETAVKMLLARFYRVQPGAPRPQYEGRTPVFVVLGDDEGGITANYHGTTVATQLLRGMWPEVLAALERENVLLVRAVRPNDMEGLETVFRTCESGPFKIAGFLHELVMMNYGARALSVEFVTRLYDLCGRCDVPTVADEIQTCVWSPEVFMFREYGVRPNIVVLGKGFPGGEFAASRVLFSTALDTLPQFGALVTNGQEELASLAYLITLKWVKANARVTAAVGEYYEERLKDLAKQFPAEIVSIEGRRHLLGVYFRHLEPAKAFARNLQENGLDISVQTYKEGCPPSALTKLPLTSTRDVVDTVVGKMRDALATP